MAHVASTPRQHRSAEPRNPSPPPLRRRGISPGNPLKLACTSPAFCHLSRAPPPRAVALWDPGSPEFCSLPHFRLGLGGLLTFIPQGTPRQSDPPPRPRPSTHMVKLPSLAGGGAAPKPWLLTPYQCASTLPSGSWGAGTRLPAPPPYLSSSCLDRGRSPVLGGMETSPLDLRRSPLGRPNQSSRPQATRSTPGFAAGLSGPPPPRSASREPRGLRSSPRHQAPVCVPSQPTRQETGQLCSGLAASLVQVAGA